jgi:hypothetical protein
MGGGRIRWCGCVLFDLLFWRAATWSRGDVETGRLAALGARKRKIVSARN